MILKNENVKKLETQWYDRKRTIFGLPLSFTTYTLNEEALKIKKGLFSINEDDIKLYRIMDITLNKTLFQRLFGVGTIQCHSNDKTLRTFDIKNVKKPEDVKELLSHLVEVQRDAKRISGREYMSGFDDEFDEI